jgi:catechol 2,3-dioxygenase-like lactoylglutathione lyase family enzyme
MAVRRIIPYHESPDFEATRTFYTGVLGLEEGNFGGGYIGFGSGQAQVVFAPPGVWTSIRGRLSMRHTIKRYGPGTR